MRRRMPGRPVGAAAIAVLASAGVCAWTLWRALDLDVLPMEGTASLEAEPRSIVRPRDTPVEVVLAAIESDPFHPERRRPDEPFRLPGEEPPPTPATATNVPAPTAPVELIGTVVIPDGRSFAMCRSGADSPRIVRIGETIGDLTLRTVEQGRAVFASSTGARTELQVKKAGT